MDKSSVREISALARRLRATAALGILAISLAGCVVYPSGYGGGYYAAPVVAPVVVGGGWGWGWRGGWGRWR
jgi:hypothetical protein